MLPWLLLWSGARRLHMPDTFIDTARRVRLHVPDAPFLLIQDWVRDAYRDFCNARQWSFLRKEAALRFNASRAVTVGVTQYSSTVTSAALFVAADAGRQFRIGTQGAPVYSIATFTNASTIVLDRNYEDDTQAAAAATILDVFPALPADFDSFIWVLNPYERRVIAHWVSQDWLNKVDPLRILTGSLLRVLSARKISSVASTSGRVLYEAWPYITSARSYPFLYKTTPGTVNESTNWVGLLADHGSTVLKHGALVHCSEWPGTAARPNPYHKSAALMVKLQDRFDKEVQRLWLIDDAMFPLQVEQASFRNLPPTGIGTPTELLRETDASVADYL